MTDHEFKEFLKEELRADQALMEKMLDAFMGVCHHLDHAAETQRRIESLVTALGERLMHTSQELLDAVNRVKTDTAARIKELTDQIANSGGNQAAIDSATDDLNSLATSLETPTTADPGTGATGTTS